MRISYKTMLLIAGAIAIGSFALVKPICRLVLMITGY